MVGIPRRGVRCGLDLSAVLAQAGETVLPKFLHSRSRLSPSYRICIFKGSAVFPTSTWGQDP